MASPYLIADEIARCMSFALRSLPASCLENERERRAAYWDAEIRADDMLQLDAEALRRERTRRRLFGAGVSVAAVMAMAHPAAAQDMEAISGALRGDLLTDAKIVGVVFLALSGFLTIMGLLRALNAWLSIKREAKPRIRIVRNAADEIWS